MKKNDKRLQKNAQQHTIEAKSTNHYYEIAEEILPGRLDYEGTLSDGYILHLNNENQKSGH